MKDLSLTQKFLLCILGDKGKISSFHFEKNICVAVCGVTELFMDGIVKLDGKNLTVRKELPEEKRFLRPVFQLIERKQPVKFEKVIESFSVSITDKKMDELIEGIEDSLEKAGCVRKEKGGLFGGKNVYIPDPKVVDCIIKNIRAEILEEGRLSEEVVALTALFHKSGDLARYFSAYEKKDMKKRLKEIKENPENEEIKRMMDYVDSLLMLIVVAAT